MAAAAALTLGFGAAPALAQSLAEALAHPMNQPGAQDRMANLGPDLKLAAADRQAHGRPTALASSSAAASVVPVANVEGLAPGQLKLSRTVLARIYRGDIAMWDAPQIARLNPGVALPHEPIAVVQQSPDSAASRTFVAMLASRSGPAGADPSKWKVGVMSQGDAGVAATVRGTRNSIGYVADGFAAEQGLPMATLVGTPGRAVEAAPMLNSGSALLLSAPSDPSSRVANDGKDKAPRSKSPF